jgi:hypothetical protein
VTSIRSACISIPLTTNIEQHGDICAKAHYAIAVGRTQMPLATGVPLQRAESLHGIDLDLVAIEFSRSRKDHGRRRFGEARSEALSV